MFKESIFIQLKKLKKLMIFVIKKIDYNLLKIKFLII